MLFRKRQQIIICVAAGTIVIGFVLFRYLPLQKRIEAVEQSRVARRLVISKSSAESAQLPAFREHLLKLERMVGNYETNVPGRRDLGMFLHRIADLMSKYNLTDQLVQPGKEIETKGVHCIPISMQCRGRLKQIFEFFGSLQVLDRSLRIEQVKLENDGDFSGEVNMRAETVIYYRQDGEQV